MAPKMKKLYVCSNCGYETGKWLGKCPDCGSWNTLTEEIRVDTPAPKGSPALLAAHPPAEVTTLDEVESGEEIRYPTGISELDRVLGGGMVPGAVMLVSGDPGIGKSTLLLKVCRSLEASLRVLYVTGEESTRQIKLRALRLGVENPLLMLCACNDVGQILATIDREHPDLVIVDSIQTISAAEISSSAGSVSQVRECTQRLTHLAKEREIPLFLVGHVNKDGAIAGPKVLEHMVDTVLYFEGERNLSYRILRAIKNRFGSTNEIGVFEMLDTGLSAVDNPSMALLAGRLEHAAGSCVTAVMEGSRPILAEIQALASKTTYPMPKRSANGLDFNRIGMLLAVLEKKCGYFFGTLDVYLNVAGGLRIDEPSADLAVILALISNLTDRPLEDSMVAFGEVGLAGEIRAVNRAGQRIGEIYRLGFRQVILPAHNVEAVSLSAYPGLQLVGIRSVRDLRRLFG
ncbi:MAG: DNA repair protein RadA [Oscillospiraceae bacterium]|nr:MAG: DNA repair protein RadA [Oscillospiraceae bacterium]